MLALHSSSGPAPAVDLSAATLPADIVWIDLCDPEPAEAAFVERVTELRLPRRADLEEIESSSRGYTEKGALYLSAPIVFRAETEGPVATPVGFVLTRERLITLRYVPLQTFRGVAEQADAELKEAGGVGAFVLLAEAIVDRIADGLERINGELDQVSRRIFGSTAAADSASTRRAPREDADLRRILRQVGRSGDIISKLRDSLLSLGRIVAFAASRGAEWIPAAAATHFKSLREDITSLGDYDAFLTGKVQLLLDATLGLINIEQNNIMKVLTIVSVVGVPPTLIAGIYGMNFKNMPELTWAWGYEYGLAIIIASAVLPLLWFKRRGWL